MQWRCNYEGREMQEKEIIKLGYLGNEKHQSTLVISKEGIAPTVERHIKYTKKIKLNARRHNVKFRSIQII